MPTTSYGVQVPGTPDELAEIMDAHHDQIVATPETHAEFLTAYVEATERTDPGLSTQIAEGVTATLVDMLRADSDTANGVREALGLGTPDLVAPPAVAPDATPGAAADGIFGSLGEFLVAVHQHRPELKGRPEGSVEAMSRLTEVMASSTTVPSEGGFLVPEQFVNQLLSTPLESEVMRPRATVLPMTSRRAVIPAVHDRDHTSSTHGGLITYWPGEAAEMTAAESEFGVVELEARKHTGFARYPDEVADDAALWGEYARRAWPQAMAWGRDIAFMEGNGINKPLGWNSASVGATVTQAKEAGQSADTIVYANALKMYARMPATSLGNAVWVTNLDTLPQIMSMELSTGSPAVMHSNIAGAPPFNLLGRPIIRTEKLPTLGDAGDFCFIDPTAYLIGDRKTMQMEVSDQRYFDTNELAMRIVERLDGRPWMSDPLTPRKGANTLSPFIRLAERA